MATNITPHDPFTDIARFDPFRDIDDLFGARRLRSLFRHLPEEPQIRMDVKEDAEAYRIKADIPGVKREDIHIEIDGNNVSISAEVRRENEERKGENALCRERYYGKAARSFTLGHDVDATRSQAKYTDGVLELTLPKKAGTNAKRLTVE
jgi:HSP20 family protein